VRLQVDDLDLPFLPAEITIANLLPWDVEAPDFQTGTIGPTDIPHAETAAEIAAFERFLDDRFPRDKFPRFRHEIDGPVCSLPNTISRLGKYRYIVEVRRQWRAAARKNRLIALLTNDKLPLLRICDWRQCQKLFVAERNNQKWCSDKCGNAFRQALRRERQKQYEVNREINYQYVKRKKDIQRRRKKGA
jgi:hypothetical protein